MSDSTAHIKLAEERIDRTEERLDKVQAVLDWAGQLLEAAEKAQSAVERARSGLRKAQYAVLVTAIILAAVALGVETSPSRLVIVHTGLHYRVQP